MKHLILFSIIYVSCAAQLYSLDIKKELCGQAETTTRTLVDKVTTNGCTLGYEAAKCRHEKKPAEAQSCLQAVLKRVQEEKTKDWKAIGNIAVAHVVVSYASNAVGSVIPNRRNNCFSQTIDLLQIPLYCGFHIACIDLASLYWLEYFIERDLEKQK